MERSGPSAVSHTARAVHASRKTTVGSLSTSASTLSEHSGTLSRSGSTLSNNGKLRWSANTGPSGKLSRSGSTIGQSDQLNAAMQQSRRKMHNSMQQSEKPSNTGPSGKLSRSGSTIGQRLAAAKDAAKLQGVEADFSRTGSSLGDRFDETTKLERGKSTLETADVVHIEDDTDLFPTEMPSCLAQRMKPQQWVEMIKMVNAQQKVWNSYLWKCCPCVADAKREEVTKQVVAIFKKYGCTVDYTAASMVVFRQVPSKGKPEPARSMLGIPVEGNPMQEVTTHPGASGSQGAKAELTPAESRALRFPRRPSQQSMPEQEVPRSPRSPRRDSKGDGEGMTPAQSRALRFPPRRPSQQSVPNHEQEGPRSPRSPRRDSTGDREELTPAQSRALRFPPRRPSQQSAPQHPQLGAVARAHSMPENEKEGPRSPRSPRRDSAGEALTPAQSRALRFPKRTQQAMPDQRQAKI